MSDPARSRSRPAGHDGSRGDRGGLADPTPARQRRRGCVLRLDRGWRDHSRGASSKSTPSRGGVENDYVYPADPINEFDLDGMKKCRTWDIGCKAGKVADFAKRNAGTIATVGACLASTAACIGAAIISAGWGAYQRARKGSGFGGVAAGIAVDLVAYRLGGNAVMAKVGGRAGRWAARNSNSVRGVLGGIAVFGIRSVRTFRQTGAGAASVGFSEWRTSRRWSW